MIPLHPRGIAYAHNAAYCIMSAPSLSCNILTPADFAYIRMHGYGDTGDYTGDALRRWAEHDTYVYFNNDWGGYAIKNAETLRTLLA